MTKEETDKVCSLLFRGVSNGHPVMNAKFVGQTATTIAEAAGIHVPTDTKLLIGPQSGVGEGNPLSFEKLTTVLGFYVVKNWEEACALSIRLLQNGIGHTMSLHTSDPDIIFKFSSKPASRILINTGGSQGGTGISTGLPIAFTLGCGTDGGSSVSDNLTPEHLINVKTVAYGIKDVTKIVAEDDYFHTLPKVAVCNRPNEKVDGLSSASLKVKKETATTVDFLNQTPQQIQENFEKNNPSTAHEISSNVTVASNDETNEAIVREILSTLKTK